MYVRPKRMKPLAHLGNVERYRLILYRMKHPIANREIFFQINVETRRKQAEARTTSQAMLKISSSVSSVSHERIPSDLNLPAPAALKAPHCHVCSSQMHSCVQKKLLFLPTTTLVVLRWLSRRGCHASVDSKNVLCIFQTKNERCERRET